MLLLLLACAPSPLNIGDDPAGDGGGDGSTYTIVPLPELDLDGPAAIDPLLGPSTYSLSSSAGVAAEVEVHDASGTLIRTLADGTGLPESVAWDGRDEAGTLVDLGDYTVIATLLDESGATVAQDELATTLVRVGVTAGTLGGDRIALCWHSAGGAGMYWDGGDADPTFQIDSIDDGTTLTQIPEPWEDLYEPPEDPLLENMPAAYAWDARPSISLVVAGDIGGAALSPAIDGWSLTSGEVSPGSTVVLTADAPITTGPGVLEDGLTLRWMSGDFEVGAQHIPLRIYALLGPPAFEEEGVPYLPWLAVIDPALRAIGGVEGTNGAVISALVDYIYHDLGLSYDTRWGASAYTEYSWNSFNDAHFDLTSFLDRSRGSVVNCTDCAAILEAFANMLGANLEYTIISPDFNLNYILAIGGENFTHCPFINGSCGFSYHAVTTPDDGATIFDATLALDGDDDPGAYPYEELLVQEIDGQEYLDRLVMSGNPHYKFTQAGSIQ